MLDSGSLQIGGFIVFISFFFTFLNLRLRLRYPPGPKGLPIIGNVLDMPKQREWETYWNWAEKYGELVHVKVLQTHIIIINSRRMAYELFERRSSNYADRTVYTMLNELMGWSWSLAFQRYGNYWRRHRRAFHEKFHAGAVGTFQSCQIKHSRDLLNRFLTTPEDFTKHIRHVAGAIIMEVAYGIQVQPKDDPYILNADAASRGLGEAGVPGAFLVDRLPFLKHIPDWVPGASFKKKARKWYRHTIDTKEAPYQFAKREYDAGTAQQSFVSLHLDDLFNKNKFNAEEETIIKNAAGIVFSGGSDTTVCVMTTFVLAMALNPTIQKKAQAELDSVLGTERLVEFEDEDDLPYIGAIVRETLRWHPLLPQGVAHAALEDDVVEGHFIPKGAIVIGNSWRLLHNEEDFGPSPFEYMPERFTSGLATRDPELTGAFGYGRRICPGRHMALNVLFIEIASILQTFDISGPLDADGKELSPEYTMESGLFSFPVNLKVSIRPRSERAVKLIREAHKVYFS